MNTLKKLQFYMGKRKVLMPIALTLSGLSGLLSLMPFIFIWLIVRSLLLTGSVASGIPINVYAWWAVGTAVAGLVIYFAGLMLLHLAAFRVETNMRRTAMRKIMQMPLGFFDRNTSGQMRKIIDENASETHTFVAHLLPDLAGSFIAPLSVIILIFVFNWQLGLACLIPLTAAVFIMTRMNTTAQKAFQNEYLGAQEHMSSEAVEYVRGISVVKVFQQTIFSFKRFYDSIIAYRDLVTKYTLGWQKPMSLYTVAINSFAFLLVPVVILLIGNKSENIAFNLGKHFSYIQQAASTPQKGFNTINWLVGADWYAPHEWTVMAQFSSESIFKYESYVAQPRHNSLLTLCVSKKLLDSNLQLSDFTYFDLNHKGWFSRFTADYALNDHIHLLAGYDWFGGSEGMFGPYKHNSEVWAKAKYCF